ncbi:hypothetical protein FGG08_007344 [Glutinoglossum americanum]|uniref:Prolyl 4-hydroxylase alpha subunit domain-containing protein n=1 Tax=Glutinoglossum americanum TaxID=1670608 RepID=A0A9P8HZH9_9PEZI|nr:hypothetical protein FGG08_007344 [Glutinoglossum americanum]
MSSSNKTTSDTLPPNFLLSKANNIIVDRIDFAKSAIPSYEGLYAVILDNVLSQDECRTLVQATEARTNGVWEPAMVNVGGGHQKLSLKTRNCGRVIWDDQELAVRIFERVRGHLPELEVLEVSRPRSKGQRFKLTRPNERLRFLRYEAGNFFRAHCDGAYVEEKTGECSFYTFHLYLSDDTSKENLKGGATTFHSWDMNTTIDIEPKVGRVLIFQHESMLHSGADVLQGVKLTMRTDLMYQKQ